MRGPFLIGVIAVLASLAQFSIHKVEEGHVGVYFRGGALLNRVTRPGWHLKFPLLDVFEQVQVTLQTDKVTNIPCGTSGGVVINFERVEVVNRLREDAVIDTIRNYTVNYDKIWIFDKIHHEINQFCSKHSLQEVYITLFHTVDERLQESLKEALDRWAPGIEIVAIRITKPRIPEGIVKNFEQIESEKTKFLVAIEAQKVAEKEAETEMKKAKIEAEKVAAVSKIKMEQQVMEKESQKQMKKLDDDALLYHEKAIADAQFYMTQKAAEANQMLLTPEFLRLEMVHSMANSTKVYFGSLSNMYLEWADMLSTVGNSALRSHAPATTTTTAIPADASPTR